MFRFYPDHALQQLVRFVQLVGLDIHLCEIPHCLKVLLQRQGFGEALYGIVCASHALGAHTVVLEYLEVFLIIFLFFLFRVCRFAGEKRFKESHGCDVVLVMLFNRLTELMCRQCTVQK